MSKVLKGATILALAGLVAKIIGVLYRIPLTNIIGSGGIGLYQMIFPLYVVLLTISSGGLPVAISKVVASRVASGDEAGAKKVLRVSLVSLSSIGIVAAVLLFTLSRTIATLQGNELATLGYKAIAPAIVLVAVIACFRGYFQGKQNMLPSAISQIVEQVFKLGVGLLLAFLLLPRGVEYAVFGALIGVSVSEVFALLALWLQYIVVNKKATKKLRGSGQLAQKHQQSSCNLDAKRSTIKYYSTGKNLTALKSENAADAVLPPLVVSAKKEKTYSILKEIYRIAIPVTLGSLVLPLTGLIDSIVVINLLTGLGMGTDAATSAFGLLTGPVGTLINMPAVITLAFAVALLPRVAECKAKGECAGSATDQAFKFSFIIGLLSTMFFALFASPVLTLLYSGGLSASEIELASRLLIIGSVSIIYVSILQVASSVLQGVGKAHIPAINLLVGACVKVALTLLLLLRLGIMGAMLATVACFSIVCTLNIIAVRRHAKVNLKVKEFLLVPLLAATAFGGIAYLLNWLLANRLHYLAVAAISFSLALAAFLTIIFALKAIDLKELKKIKIFRKFFRKCQDKELINNSQKD